MNNMVQLTPFAEDDRGSVSLFEAEARVSADGLLWVRYQVDADSLSVALKAHVEPERRDGLWQSTCFEIFLKYADQDTYLEYNFSPSGHWAAYCFESYRKGMADLPVLKPPEIHIDAGEHWFSVEATVSLPAAWGARPLFANITAVIADADGALRYWAIKHPETQADFHNPDCFVLPLKAEAPS